MEGKQMKNYNVSIKYLASKRPKTIMSTTYPYIQAEDVDSAKKIAINHLLWDSISPYRRGKGVDEKDILEAEALEIKTNSGTPLLGSKQLI